MTTAVSNTELATTTRGGVLIAGWAGILWGVLSIARIPFTGEGDMPLWTAPPSEIAAFYEGQSFDTTFMIGVAMVSVGWALLLVFIAKVSGLLGDRLRWVGYLILGGAAIEIAGAIAYLSTVSTGAFWASNGGLSPDSYLILNGLIWSFVWIDLIMAGLWLIPLAIVVLRTGLFPRWLGWAILATALANFLAFFLPPEFSYVPGALPYLWVLIAGVIMLVRADRYAAPVAAT